MGYVSRLIGWSLLGCLLACAAPAPLPTPKPASSIAPEQRVAAVRAAAGSDDKEFAVQPLRDPMVEDLRQTATRLESLKKYPDAAKALDQALSITPDDPAVLQERAEVALFLEQFDNAEALARRAYALGAKVGPLCRRHWAAIEQALKARHANADEARKQIAACKVATPERF
ncbi:MAG TPA: hypothetical protein VNI56_01115 [Xanthomonadaceae bacterium]|nr:hypothetical protein [Xanthomonadaceae bacterium]